MRILLIICCLLVASVSWADNAKKVLQQYPYWIRAECKRLTSYRDRKATYYDYSAALQCARNTVDYLQEQEARDAELELTEEKIKWLRANRQRNSYPRDITGER